MSRPRLLSCLTVAACLALLIAGCGASASETGSFDRTLTVSGPVRLELSNGSDGVRITGDSAGQVRVHGEIRARGWTFDDARKRVADILAHPPVEQSGSVVRIGKDNLRLRNISISYTIEVPRETEVETSVGSGSQTVRDVRGPLKLASGSGEIRAERITQDAQVATGSGSITAAEIGGDLRAITGSGTATLSGIHGDVRVAAGSGDITIAQPGGRITAKTGSGAIAIRGASGDLTAHTGSGRLTIEGAPASNSFWELHAGSGGVDLGVPPAASFRLSATARSGSITVGIPIVIEEQSRHELRARVGQGGARVEVETASGSIRIHP